jgi:LysR family hydrogen peroxide-inducible transcriptional activator
MDRFDHFHLFDERLLLAVGDGDPLLEPEAVRLADLKDRLVLTLEDGHCLRNDAMSYCFAAGAREDQRFRATSLETLRFMVASGIGITLMPELAVDHTTNHGVHYRQFAEPEPSRRIVALVRRGYPRMDCVREIVSVIRKLTGS